MASVQPSGAWPDLVLEQVFSNLPLGDLVSCRHVCRQWRALACLGRLQARCLLQTWTWHHRQQLEQAVNSPVLRPALALWCDRPRGGQATADCVPSAQDLLRTPSAQDLLRTIVQRLLLATHISLSDLRLLDVHAMEAGRLVCSPDGRWLAFPLRKLLISGGNAIGLLRMTPRGWQSENVIARDSPVCQLMFSADSRRLYMLLASGRQYVWELDASDSWRGLSHRFPFSAVCKVAVSADARFLAVAVRDNVLLYGAGERGDWRGGLLWRRARWHDGNQRFLGIPPHQLAMQWSPDSRHFAFGWDCDAFVCSRDDTGWNEQVLPLAYPVRGQPLFDPDSRLLVMATAPRCTGEESVAVRIRIWCWDGELRWFERQDIWHEGQPGLAARSWPLAGYPVPMAFSPDGRLLAAPSSGCCQDIFLWPVTGAAAWSQVALLRCGDARYNPPVHDGVQNVQFSATSRALAVVTGRAVHLWTSQWENRWRRELVLELCSLHCAMELAWSPDGYHLAVAMGGRGTVSIWGPAAGEQFGCKLNYQQGHLVEQLLFTPDGTRLIISSFGQADLSVEAGLVGDRFIFCSCLAVLPLVPQWREPDSAATAQEIQEPQEPQALPGSQDS